MKINKFLFKLLTIIFNLVLFTINVYVGPPPGASVDASGIEKVSSYSKEKNTKLFFNIGTYSPSLTSINNDLKYYGISPVHSGSFYTIGIGENKYKFEGFFSYWSGSTKNVNFKETIVFYILGFNVNIWEISKLFPKPYDEIFGLNLNFIARDIFATLKDEYIASNTYIFCTALTIDFGTGINFEFFPLKENKIVSVSLGWDYILFSLPLLPFEVWDTNINGFSFGDNYQDHNGKDIFAETQGTILKFEIKFYF